jgi:hypothetical protein
MLDPIPAIVGNDMNRCSTHGRLFSVHASWKAKTTNIAGAAACLEDFLDYPDAVGTPVTDIQIDGAGLHTSLLFMEGASVG